MALVSALFWLIRSLITPRKALAAENLALRQQLAVLNRKVHRPQLHRRDRFFWVILSQLWKNWRQVLIIVKPETVIKWHRQGFKLYWRWKSKAPVGRPKIDKEIRELIKRMSLENPLWGTPRIQSELRLLGFDLAESTVAKYRVRGSASPSQTWNTFLSNHAKQSLASLLRLLSQLSPASGIGQELADSTRGRRASEGQGHLNSTSRRFASLLPTSRLTLAIWLAPGDIDGINGETTSAGRDSCASLQTYAPST